MKPVMTGSHCRAAIAQAMERRHILRLIATRERGVRAVYSQTSDPQPGHCFTDRRFVFVSRDATRSF